MTFLTALNLSFLLRATEMFKLHEIWHGLHAHEHLASQKNSFIFSTILNEFTVHLWCRCTRERRVQISYSMTTKLVSRHGILQDKHNDTIRIRLIHILWCISVVKVVHRRPRTVKHALHFGGSNLGVACNHACPK